MRDIVEHVKALADDNRLRILHALESGELCVCQVIELLGLAPSTVSKHLAILKTARLVEARKEGRWVHYSLATATRFPEARETRDLLLAALKRTAAGKRDNRHIKKIRSMDMEALCRKAINRN